MVECEQCRFIRLFPRPTAEEMPVYYPREYYFAPGGDLASQLAEAYRRLVLHDHAAFVAAAIGKRTGPIIDVGCSGGLLARLLRDRGYRVTGFDNSHDAARAAWCINGVPVTCGDFLAAPIRDGSCSVITMFHLLEHVPDPRAYLESAWRLLEDGGRLVVQVPNAASWQFLLFGPKWNGVDVPRHLWNFRDTDLEWLLKRCGFEVVRRKYFSLRDNPAGLATTLAPSLDPMSRRVRNTPESTALRIAKDTAYLALSALCLPLAALEAACHAGSTVMVEARRIA